ncbi:hypothetical protein HDE_05727 [Halotydeus destructor]|nr:hypothetical protein HDE_05727 [Halotydeus destructor]
MVVTSLQCVSLAAILLATVTSGQLFHDFQRPLSTIHNSLFGVVPVAQSAHFGATPDYYYESGLVPPANQLMDYYTDSMARGQPARKKSHFRSESRAKSRRKAVEEDKDYFDDHVRKTTKKKKKKRKSRGRHKYLDDDDDDYVVKPKKRKRYPIDLIDIRDLEKAKKSKKKKPIMDVDETMTTRTANVTTPAPTTTSEAPETAKRSETQVKPVAEEGAEEEEDDDHRDSESHPRSIKETQEKMDDYEEPEESCNKCTMKGQLPRKAQYKPETAPSNKQKQRNYVRDNGEVVGHEEYRGRHCPRCPAQAHCQEEGQ